VAESSPRDVFINCPFDEDFAQGFRALVFAVRACGFRARCAREVDDGSETRLDKIYRIIEQSRYGIHDISRTELDTWNGLPRFNMPLELGVFLGAKRFGGPAQKEEMRPGSRHRTLSFSEIHFRSRRHRPDAAWRRPQGDDPMYAGLAGDRLEALVHPKPPGLAGQL
jgi:hypothetical protein